MFDFITAKQHPVYTWILVDPTGLIWNSKTGHKYKLIENRQDGYYRISIKQTPKRIRVMVHRLVAETFVINHNELPEVNHKDGIKTNNNYQNLEWSTHSQNTIHAYESGLYKTRKKK